MPDTDNPQEPELAEETAVNPEPEAADLETEAAHPEAPHQDASDDEAFPAEEGLDVGHEEGEPGDALADALPEAVAEEETKRWYIIHTYSGFERKVAESLRTRADAFGFSHEIGQILIPEEDVVELRNGKKVTSKRLLYPGYVVVQMEMNDELWHRVKDTPRVTGFVGGGQTPVPLSADEINKMLYRQTTAAERPRPKMTFEKGELVRIIDGPFANFQGKVDEVNPERNTLRVLVTIFGRATPVELDFLQVEKTA
jgi:transcriptional antiterminator NusG